jgi:hypothetical protein
MPEDICLKATSVGSRRQVLHIGRDLVRGYTKPQTDRSHSEDYRIAIVI